MMKQVGRWTGALKALAFTLNESLLEGWEQ